MRKLKAYVETFFRYRYLLLCLVDRDYKVKYRRSVLGILWSMLNPIMMMIVLNAVFSRVFRADIENFPLYLITGQVVFSFFSEASSSAIFSIVEASSLIKKVYVPKYAQWAKQFRESRFGGGDAENERKASGEKKAVRLTAALTPQGIHSFQVLRSGGQTTSSRLTPAMGRRIYPITERKILQNRSSGWNAQ